jgi:hypothetical protein
MKRYILSGIAALMIAAVAAWNLGFNTPSGNLSDISLANVEALASEFYWDGKMWNDSDTHWLGSNWMPVKTTCRLQYGIGYVVEVDGYKVTCNHGNGNCFIESRCTNA